MKKYYKEENDRRVWFDGILRVNGKQTINPTEEMILADGWVEYIPPTPVEPTAEELLQRAKNRKLLELYDYDKSKEVDDCIIVYQGVEYHYWKDKTERDSLKGAVSDFIKLGRDKYRLDLREHGITIWFPCEDLLMFMAQLEVHAADSFNKTTDHDFAINACTTEEEVNAYNFRTGYPDIPRFEL